MKNLIKTTTNLPVAPIKFVKHVLQNKPAFQDAFSKVKNVVLAEILKSFTSLTWKLPEDDDIQVMVNEITTNIQEKFKTLRKEEIPTAFAKGIRGEYGEYMGLSVVTFEKFIMGYLNSPYRANLGKTLPRLEIAPAAKELTRQDRIEWALSAFEKFKSAGHYDDFANKVYDILDSENLIPFSVEEKKEIYEQARQQEYRRLQNPLSMTEARKFNKQIEELMDDGNKETKERLAIQAKKNALNKYFKILKDTGKDLVFS